MANETNVPQESAIVEVSDETALVKEGKPEETDEVKNETVALIEAIKREAQSEVQKAGDFTREKYLEAVRTAREQIEKMNLFDPERIEEAIKQVQKEVEKDWDALVKEVNTIGDRLSDAAKAAWEALTAPRPDDSSSDSES
ncbi:MAG: hypothetical protein AB4426_24160 [Xenococcaceae cyanobacterium]